MRRSGFQFLRKFHRCKTSIVLWTQCTFCFIYNFCIDRAASKAPSISPHRPQIADRSEVHFFVLRYHSWTLQAFYISISMHESGAMYTRSYIQDNVNFRFLPYDSVIVANEMLFGDALMTGKVSIIFDQLRNDLKTWPLLTIKYIFRTALVNSMVRAITAFINIAS